ncbi:MAG: hypothetical protein LKM31_02910 [Sphingobium sp.]|jgi:hypothetical protein|nr:hypothetical protein [Sphingobium sp.]
MRRSTGCGRNGRTCCALRNIGIPTVGFTWYSLTDQVDWDTALREQNGNVNPLGLYDLDRKIRAVGKAYHQIIKDWRDVLPRAERMPGGPDRAAITHRAHRRARAGGAGERHDAAQAGRAA